MHWTKPVRAVVRAKYLSPQYNTQLYNLLSAQPYLGLYKILQYPIPQNYQYFAFSKKYNPDEIENTRSKTRTAYNSQTEFFSSYIQRFNRLYKTLPRVKNIYICNSLSFNATKEDSDIDLFFVVEKGKLRRARFWSVLLFFILGIKRTSWRHKKKFCLSFYVTQDAQNLYDITLPKNDIYLAYWLAHLVPLYQQDTTQENIYTYNQRLKSILPNFPMQHIIQLPIRTLSDKTRGKRFLEYITGGILGKLQEHIIALIRIPIIHYKRKKIGPKWEGVVVRPTMLKFYADARKKISLLHTQYCKKHFPKLG